MYRITNKGDFNMNNYNSFLNVGGGNSLNIIRVASINEFLYILYDATLNGNIVAGNEDTWHKVRTYYNWSQVNKQDTACVYGVGTYGDIYRNQYHGKSRTTQSDYALVFRPIIEFKE